MATSEQLRQDLHRLIDRLPDQQLEKITSVVREVSESSWIEILRTIPGARVPAHWPPQFEPFEPIPFEGEPPSERLIRERR